MTWHIGKFMEQFREEKKQSLLSGTLNIRELPLDSDHYCDAPSCNKPAKWLFSLQGYYYPIWYEFACEEHVCDRFKIILEKGKWYSE